MIYGYKNSKPAKPIYYNVYNRFLIINLNINNY